MFSTFTHKQELLFDDVCRMSPETRFIPRVIGKCSLRDVMFTNGYKYTSVKLRVSPANHPSDSVGGTFLEPLDRLKISNPVLFDWVLDRYILFTILSQPQQNTHAVKYHGLNE